MLRNCCTEELLTTTCAPALPRSPGQASGTCQKGLAYVLSCVKPAVSGQPLSMEHKAIKPSGTHCPSRGQAFHPQGVFGEESSFLRWHRVRCSVGTPAPLFSRGMSERQTLLRARSPQLDSVTMWRERPAAVPSPCLARPQQRRACVFGLFAFQGLHWHYQAPSC